MVNRINGFSGFDVEGTITKLMKAERVKTDVLKQALQRLTWQQEAYRGITNVFRSFKDEYFNILKPATNFRSTTAFASFGTSSSNSSIVSVTAGAGATPGSRKIEVTKLAGTAVKTGDAGASKGTADGLTGAKKVDMDEMREGKQFTLTLDGVSKTIVLDKNYANISDLVGDSTDGLQRLINDAFGANKIKVSVTGTDSDKLNFKPATISSNLRVADGTNTYLSTLGLADGQSNAITSKEITDFSGGKFKLQVGTGEAIEIDVASASGTGTTARDNLITNINDALSAKGVVNVKVIADDTDPAKPGIKLVALDTADKMTLTSGSSNNLLTKLGISSGSSTNLSGTINYSTNDTGKDFYIKIDGTQYHIDLTKDYTNDADFQNDLRSQLSTQGAPASVELIVSGGKISFKTTSTHEIVLQKGDAGLRDELGFTDAVNSNKINLGDSMENLAANLKETVLPYNAAGNIEFTVNGVTITATKEDSLKKIMDKINTSEAGVNMRYDSLTDKFILESKDSGLAAKVDITDVEGKFFEALKVNTTDTKYGKDAELTIDGNAVTRSSNKFAIDGVTYELKGLGESTITVTSDPDKLIGNINDFVAKYNQLLDTVNGKLNEKSYQYAKKGQAAYTPLTDEQKKDMSEEDIKLWQEKAQSGLLRSDPLLEKAMRDLRSTLFAKVEGVDISLFDIGITTSSAWQDGGKLVIDEDKLRKAIEEKPDKVARLFTQDSDISYDSADRAGRFKQQGVAQRMFDVIEDNIRTTRDSKGNKGLLLEKAGIDNDTTDQDNFISERMKEENKRLETLMEKLLDKEDSYYRMFSAMETAMQRMSSQSAWLSQQFGGGQS